MRFEWDLAKEKINVEKHGVDFLEAASCFADTLGFAGFDKEHSSQMELRWFWFGRSTKGRILTIRYTQREQTIRIIGAGAWREGKKYYERNSNE